MTENAKYGCLPKLQSKAPDFKAAGTYGDVSLQDYRGKWLVFFSHPSDFSPVCTSEMLAFSKAWEEFNENGCELLGLSVDSNASHLAWMQSIYESTGVIIPFPIIEDRRGEIARKYGMISPGADKAAPVRAVYIIDTRGVVRAIMSYPLCTGRSVLEILRLVRAIQAADSSGAATPADWQPGDAVIEPCPTTYSELLGRRSEDKGRYRVDWYLCFIDLPCEAAGT